MLDEGNGIRFVPNARPASGHALTVSGPECGCRNLL